MTAVSRISQIWENFDSRRTIEWMEKKGLFLAGF
jgi:hypothetical protein